MDSVTQLTLGAAIGVAVMGRTQPAWKSAIIGGICGTLPDLDAFIDHGDAISNMVLHRADTHALIWQGLAAPFIATVFAIADRSISLFFRWWLLTLIVLTTHAGLDAMTVYGTQLGLPLTNMPYGIGSIFIIDPMYTLPLMLGVLIAVFGDDRFRWNIAAIVFSTAYLGATVLAQQHVMNQVVKTNAARGVPKSQILVTPAPFNALLWRIVIMLPDRYEEAYYSLLDPIRFPDRVMRFEAFDRGAALDAATRNFNKANQIRAFSKGFYAVSARGDGVVITDLRMGQNPWYVFSFEFAKRKGKTFVPVTPVNVANRSELPFAQAMQWLGQRILGVDVSPPRQR